jgi:hypothetical protein
MDIPTPMCRGCGVDRELVDIEHPHANFDVPHYRCPKCRDTLRLAVRRDHATTFEHGKYG